METLVTPVEHKVILHGVSWETYERLLNEHQESPGTHFIYDEGELGVSFPRVPKLYSCYLSGEPNKASLKV